MIINQGLGFWNPTLSTAFISLIYSTFVQYIMVTLLMECDLHKMRGDIMSYLHKQDQLDAQYITNITEPISKQDTE